MKNNFRGESWDRVLHPNNEIDSNFVSEWEFDSQTLYCVQSEFSAIYFKTEKEYGKTDILEYRLYDYIHPDILDTISFKYEEIKRGYDKKCAVEQIKRDSAYGEFQFVFLLKMIECLCFFISLQNGKRVGFTILK